MRSQQAPSSIKPESKRVLLGHAAAGALSTGHPLGSEAADALSAGAIKLESMPGHLPGDKAADALSAGAIKLGEQARPTRPRRPLALAHS